MFDHSIIRWLDRGAETGLQTGQFETIGEVARDAVARVHVLLLACSALAAETMWPPVRDGDAGADIRIVVYEFLTIPVQRLLDPARILVLIFIPLTQ